MPTEKTKEQVAQEKQAAKDLKAAERAEAREKKRLEREAAKVTAKEAREKARKEKADKREADKVAKAAEREKNRMPEQNGIRRPKPDTLCGKVWAIADRNSKKGPVSIAVLLSKCEGMNQGNVKAEYARWRKFNGVTGRIAAPKAAPKKKAA